MNNKVGDKLVKDSFDELMYDILNELRYPDFICSPRGSEVKELLAARLCLTDPRNRLLKYDCRDAKYGFAVGEFLWYWRGANDLESISYYNKRMPAFSDDGKTLNSAYGKRIKADRVVNDICAGYDTLNKKEPGHWTQWEVCVETLRKDSDSRRALLLINKAADQHEAAVVGSSDVPCTLSLQFFIREDKLYLHTNMRSNDVHWGLAYDLFSFTMFQECMLLELKEHYPNLEMGRYFHTAGSLHCYEHHYELSDNMMREHEAKYYQGWTRGLGPRGKQARYSEAMEPLKSLKELDSLMKLENLLRVEGRDATARKLNWAEEFKGVSPTILWMAQQLYDHRKKRDKE